jgi:hypothetical protein
MEIWQRDFVIWYSLFALLFAVKGFWESAKKKNPYGQYVWINVYGAFVWADAAILCLFWAVAGSITLYLNSWNLFLLIFSVFWFIRSLGETFYWFLTQFVQKKDKEEAFWLSKFFPQGSIWFVNQMLWQCVSILSLLTTIYFSYQWITHN